MLLTSCCRRASSLPATTTVAPGWASRRLLRAEPIPPEAPNTTYTANNIRSGADQVVWYVPCQCKDNWTREPHSLWTTQQELLQEHRQWVVVDACSKLFTWRLLAACAIAFVAVCSCWPAPAESPNSSLQHSRHAARSCGQIRCKLVSHPTLEMLDTIEPQSVSSG
jgi:hypothetical protein